VGASVRKLQQCVRRLRGSVSPRKRQHWILAIASDTLPSMPGLCACCLAKPTASKREVAAHGASCVIVPYCEACQRHVARSQVMRLGTVYASTLLAIFGGALVATLWPSLWQTSLCAVAISLLPLIWSHWLSLPRQLGHAARDRAVVAIPRGIAFASQAYAELAREGLGIAAKAEPLRTRRLGPLDLLGPVMALVLTPSLNYLFFPMIRVLNLTDRTLTVTVDNRPLVRVEPTSTESPAAGAVAYAPSGRHRLVARDEDGVVASDAVVQIRSGFRHLYAPGANDECFYLQRVSHGRSLFEGEGIVPLASNDRFWAIPNSVDLWFAPESAVRSGATTGGVVTHLRMRRCR
jgi:hypothetical protein